MPEPLLLTKLFIPPARPDHVLRSRLIEQLSGARHCTPGVTLISAPAGFGKTTLASEWLAGSQKPVAWLSLDEGDNDLPRFLMYLIAALQTIQANIGSGALAALRALQTQPTFSEPVLTTLLNEIATLPGPFILVLDDTHVIDAQPVGQALAFLVEHLPRQIHLVIITREDPHLPLARLRARGQLNELRAADLRFTPSEAAEYLNRMMGLNLTDADIAALEDRTEGWIAGLQLAALSMQPRQDTASFIQSFTGSHRFVLDYLIEEVLQRQTAEVQAFLLRTSILERLCGQLCDEVLQSPAGTSQKILEHLEHANLFIVPLDNERRWYRYHQLFGDLLRQILGQSLTNTEISKLHLRASHWYETSGDGDESFRHAYAAGDLGRAARLSELAFQGMDNRFQTAAWLSRAKKLPKEIVQIRPVLSTQMAQAFMDAGEPVASEEYMQDAERCLSSPSSEIVVTDAAQLESLPAMIAMTRAYNAQVQGDLSATVKYTELALSLIPEGDLFRRAQATITLEVTHWTLGDLEAARSALVSFMNSMQKAGKYAFTVASAFALADILVAQGRLREAIATYQHSLRLAAEHGPEAQRITAHHYLGLALLQHEMGDDAGAVLNLQKAEEMGPQTTLVDWSYRWHLAQARFKETAGDLEAALVQLDEARRSYVLTPIPDARPIEALKASVYLKQGRLAKAQAWVRERGLSVDDEISYLGEFEHLILARVLMSKSHNRQDRRTLAQSIGLLDRLLNAAEAQRRTASVIEILLVQALTYQAQGNLPQSLSSLERALTLAEPEGYVRIFVDEGIQIYKLLVDLRAMFEKQSSDRSHPLLVYGERLLFALQPTQVKSPVAHPQKVDLIEPLSEREMEVLKLLRTELSGPEIAEQLIISPNTFRTHTKNIFSKLGVNNRRAAVSRAEELNLF